jgi:DNA repair exonuclease SbcCD nuclease subunit
MSKTILLGDLHFGVSGASIPHHEYMRKFFKDFFEYIDEHDIRTVIQLGDMFDVRKHINTWSLNFFKETFLVEVLKRNLIVYVLLGNHDIFYRESLEISSVEEVLKDYKGSFVIVKQPIDVDINNNSFLLIPWVCKENVNDVQAAITNSRSTYCAGHFEFNGFELFKGQIAKTHYNHTDYKKFKQVFSGHYHHKSSKDNVLYTGTPYELTWSDCNTEKGFFVLDGTDLTFVPNKHTLYSHFSLSSVDKIVSNLITDKFVKIVVDKVITPKERDVLLDTIHTLKPHSIRLIEKQIDVETNNVTFESVSGISDLIVDYVSAIELPAGVDKEDLSSLMMSWYVEASANAS